MKKIKKGLSVLTVIVLMLAFAGQASAFCVTNKSDVKMYVQQNSLNASFWVYKRFSARLAPGERACCNWQNTDCNKTDNPAAEVSFKVYYGYFVVYVCKDFRIRADGDLYITGTNYSYSCSR